MRLVVESWMKSNTRCTDTAEGLAENSRSREGGGGKSKWGRKKLTDTGVGLHSRIRGGMLECRLPIRQPLCWNGQMEGIYTSVSSALIGDGPTSRAPVAMRADQSICRVYSWISLSLNFNLILHDRGRKKKKILPVSIPPLRKVPSFELFYFTSFSLEMEIFPKPLSLSFFEKEKMRKIFAERKKESRGVTPGYPCSGRGYPLLIAKAK